MADERILQGVDPTTQPSFTLRNRCARAVWNMAWLLLFRPSPRPLHAWRALLLRLFGARLGRHVHVYPSVRIWAPWLLQVGEHSGIADGVTLYNMGGIRIGPRCVVSQGAHLCGGSHDYQQPSFQLVAAPIELQAEVWVCAEAFVSAGVTVPAGCVVAARSVVTRTVAEPWTVLAGVPARVVGRRDPRASRLASSVPTPTPSHSR
ncbi:MAG: putative colanic acid biosynthesis acetyltransferase [Aquincola tertiaricarbonis]|uniref:acetyltransferase n=1 Tax=Aquincola tertiaricarbonis TaxID=391953 RepID=UPI000614CD7C|nr:acetyltransferase [Aquincola tertiaricarbonis]